MNKHITRIAGIIIILCVFLTACKSKEKTLLDDLVALEGGDVADATIDQMKAGIKLLTGEVERTIEAGVQLVNYYKMVAQRYMAQELYGLAAEFYRKALDLAPANASLAYRLGLCTSQVARSQPDVEIRQRTFENALGYHRYAVELDPTDTEALYAIAVLLIFELDRIADAETYLRRLLQEQPDHINGMFLLARVHANFSRYQDAIALYDRIIRDSNDEEQVNQAKENRAALNGGFDGG